MAEHKYMHRYDEIRQEIINEIERFLDEIEHVLDEMERRL